MDEIGVSVYHGRALQLTDAMQLCRDDLNAYGSAAALLAVRSAISYNDAILLSLVGRRSKADDHQQAVIATEQACADARIKEQGGLKHLRTLLRAKSEVSYYDRQLEPAMIEGLCVAAERFRVAGEVLSKLEKNLINNRKVRPDIEVRI